MPAGAFELMMEADLPTFPVSPEVFRSRALFSVSDLGHRSSVVTNKLYVVAIKASAVNKVLTGIMRQSGPLGDYNMLRSIIHHETDKIAVFTHSIKPTVLPIWLFPV